MEKLRFDDIKEAREGYYVTYLPPFSDFYFATLQVTFIEDVGAANVAATMEQEIAIWLGRYPVPIMATAFDDTDAVIRLDEVRSESHLVGWIEPNSGKQATSWVLGDLDKYNQAHPLDIDLRDIYAGLPYKTDADVRRNAERSIKETRRKVFIVKLFVIFWFVIVPAGVALFEYFGPEWLGLVVLLYSLWKALQEWRKYTGHREPSKLELEKREKDRKMRHYYYHCELNPAGFQRLLSENLDEKFRHDIHREYGAIKRVVNARPYRHRRFGL